MLFFYFDFFILYLVFEIITYFIKIFDIIQLFIASTIQQKNSKITRHFLQIQTAHNDKL